MNVQHIIQFFIIYKYQAIFPIAVAEGHIITLICGFLVSVGILKFFPTLLLVSFADVISDIGYHFLGKGGRKMMWYLNFKHISEEKFKKLEDHFKKNPWKTMIIGKVSYGLGSVFMIATGAARMPLKNFIGYIVVLNFIRSFILITIGYYFGKVAVYFGPTYLKCYACVVIIFILTLIFILKNRNK
jgi:membrane protein DedA with SNARE-associated domain